jgi:hypothetical protein
MLWELMDKIVTENGEEVDILEETEIPKELL